MYKVNVSIYPNSKEDVVACALFTRGKNINSLSRKKIDKMFVNLVQAEHSPIAEYRVKIDLELPYYASTHLARHNKFSNHYVFSQRRYKDRGERRQDELVQHRITTNLMSLINISRKRLCHKADNITRQVWEEVVKQICNQEPQLIEYLVPECIYRGGCPEMESCGR